MNSDSLKNAIYKMCREIIYLVYMYKKYLALNNLQWLICYENKPNKTIFIKVLTIWAGILFSKY